MTRLFSIIRPFILWIERRPVVTLLVAGLISVLGAYQAVQLRIDTDLARLLPRSSPSVQALTHLRETVGSESAISVIIESPSFDANVAYADQLIPRLLGLRDSVTSEPLLVRVDYRKDTQFLENNALYFATENELQQLERYLIRQKVRANSPLPFHTRNESADALPMQLVEAYETIIPREYPVSADSTTLVLRFYASGQQTNLGFVSRLYRSVEEATREMKPSAYHPDMEVSVGGSFQRPLVEVRAIRRDVIGSFGGGLTTVLLIVLFYFVYKGVIARRGHGDRWSLIWLEVRRMPLTAVLIALPLAMSLSWTFGFAAWVFGFLNLMTSTLVLVLFGLGVDYGIHFYARYLEERTRGFYVREAIERTFMQTGPAIAVSAFTTAAALFVLVIADFQGFSQFGVIAGVGVLSAMIAMLSVLPALLIVAERLHAVLPEQDLARAEPFDPPGPGKPYPGIRFILPVAAVLTVAGLVAAPRLHFEYEFGKLEPHFPAYDTLRAKESEVYPSGRRNPAFIVVDSLEDISRVTQELRRRAEADTTSPTILSIESLQERYPIRPDKQQTRLEHLETIRRLLDDPFLRALGSTDVERLRKAAGTTSPVPADSVPDFLKTIFTSKSGTLGKYVIVYPSVGLSDGRLSMEFAKDVGSVEMPNGRTYTAASTSIVAANMLRLMLDESPLMIVLTSGVLLLILLLTFRSWRYTLLALFPLVIGVIWMVGLLMATGVQLSFYNLVVLPAMLGIGVDGGVHIVHRFIEDGRGSIRHILSSTGEHVFVGSLTTLVAFAWWLFSHHPGLNSIGQLAVMGIGSVLIAGLVVLPALLQFIENRGHKRRPEESDG